MYKPRNGSPFHNKIGTEDNSVPPLIRRKVGNPIHKPLVFTFAGRCVTNEAFPLAGDNLLSLMGRDVIDPKSRYATFYTPLIKLFNENANEMMVQRLETDDAKTATHRMCAEVTFNDVPEYKRLPNGEVMFDADGAPIVKGQIEGMIIVYRQVTISDKTGLFRNGKVTEGTMTNKDGTKSKVYPLWDIKAPYSGDDANGFGYRLMVPHPKAAKQVSPDKCIQTGARIYDLSFVETLAGSTTPTNWNTLGSQSSVQFSFLKDAHFKPMRQDLDFNLVVPKAYRNLTPDIGGLPDFGPFEEFYIYRENLETLLGDAKGKILNAPEEKYLVDIFNGVDLNGNSYDGLVVNPSSESDLRTFDQRSTHFLEGGDCGVMNDKVYDELVRREMNGFPRDGAVKYDNELKYGLGALWDFGFSMETKQAMTNYIGRSRNTWLALCANIYDQPDLDAAGEESMKIALSEMCLAVPDTLEFGTACHRAIIVGQYGELRASSIKGNIPFIYCIADFWSKYAGAKEGKLKNAYRFSRGEQTVIENMVNISSTYKTPEVYATDWDVGLIAARSYDYYRNFVPAINSVYPEDRSVLNNAFFSFLIPYFNRLADRIWADMSGESTMTRKEMSEEVEKRFIAAVAGNIDNFADVVPKAYFTEEDISNGYSISLDINAYGGVLLTQFNTTTRVFRRE